MSALSFRSEVEGIEWPALPAPGNAAVLALLFQMEQSQWWPPEEIRRHQDRQLASLLDHARRTVPFYRDRLAQLGSLDGDALSEAWSRVPRLRRSEIQAAGSDLVSTALPRGHGEVYETFTSGSTGRPIRSTRSDVWFMLWRAVTLRDHIWQRRDLRGKLAGIRESDRKVATYPDGVTHGAWSDIEAMVAGHGPAVALNIHCSIEQQVEWLARQDPDYLLTFPSNAAYLAEYCLSRGVRLPKLREVITISERLDPAVRVTCREAWSVGIGDIYSAREAGYLALQCSDYEHYHVQSEVTLVEVLDEAGRPVAPGGVGQVVVTPLHNFAMPLIRYEIGDLAELGGPCGCGRGLPVLRRILGRTQQMLVLPSGERRIPLLSSGSLKTLIAAAPIRQYQLCQKSLEHIELRLVTARRLEAGEEERLRGWVREKFGYPFVVSFSYHDEIPRNPAGKYQDFVSELGGASAFGP
ncbi:MAG: phenylacetate--CoA ligase family protein [Alphaproteobacteria bacterium]